MAVTRDVLEAIHQRRSGPNPGSDLFATIDSFALTPAELAALVTPVNFAFPPCYVDRYGTNVTPGTTDMSPYFTAAIKVAQQGGGTVRYGASGIYLVTNDIDATFGTSANQNGVIIAPDITNNDGSPAATILAKHTGNVFDCAGNSCIDFRGVSIRTDPTVYPKVGILWARAQMLGDNSQINRASNCRLFGNFSVAGLYNYGSETSHLVGCYIENTATDAGSKGVAYTADNYAGITSKFVSIRTGSQSCIAHAITACQIANLNTDATADGLYLEGATDLKCTDTWMDCRGRSFVGVDGSSQTSGRASFVGLTGENSAPFPKYGICFIQPPGALTYTGWGIYNSYLPSTTRAIFADTNVTIDSMYAANVQEASGNGIECTVMQGSTIDWNTTLKIGTSKQNMLISDPVNFTIGARQDDYWIDKGSSANKKSWSPNTSGLTIVGALTISEKHCVAHGPLVTVTTTFSAATSISCAAGSVISGLPYTPAFRSALAAVFNETDKLAIGQALVETNGDIYLPAISVGANKAITISATYFAA